MQPGDTIRPDGKVEGAPAPSTLPEPVVQAQPSPLPPVNTQPASAPPPAPGYNAPPTTNFVAEEPTLSPEQGFTDEVVEVEWSASEYIHNQKNANWFIRLGLVTAVLAGLLYLLTQDIVNVVVAIIVVTLFGVTAGNKPRTLGFRLTNRGLYIANKFYGFDIIKSFSVMKDGAINSIQLNPLKRFMPPLSIYYPPEHENSIFESLSHHVPYEERNHDPVDRLMKRIGF